MTRRQSLELALLTTAVLATRFAFRSHFLYDVDSVNFALAIRHFDPRLYQPHPPGYFLYVLLARLVSTVIPDANSAMVAIGIAASCGAVGMIYVLARTWFGPRAATASGLVFVFSPLAWFHGTVALTYILESFFSALCGYLCWRVYSGRSAHVWPAAIVLGIGAGIRPSSVLMLGPLLVFSLWNARLRLKIGALCAFVAVVLAWAFSMVRESGGLNAYFSSLLSLWKLAGGRETVFNSSPATSIARFLTILLIYGLCFGAAVCFSPIALRRRTAIPPAIQRFSAIWVAPALLFFTFVFLRFVNSGYLLVILPPACLWLGLAASHWYDETHLHPRVKVALLVAGAALNVLIFLGAPFYCSYTSVRRLEAQLRQLRATLPQVAPPAKYLIVGFDSHFLGYRHAGYYFPEYTTVQYPEVQLVEGRRVFLMYQRDTSWAERLDPARFSNFVFFSLPAGDPQYSRYHMQVRAKLPASDLKTLRADRMEFTTGPVQDLSTLFPRSTTVNSAFDGVNSR